jgi:hypothetical protein
MRYDKLSQAYLKRSQTALEDRMRAVGGPRRRNTPACGGDASECLAQVRIIEEELRRRKRAAAADRAPTEATSAPVPAEAVLYDLIRACLAYEDRLPADASRPFNARTYGDWRVWAERLEIVLDRKGYKYKKIAW